MKYQYFSVPNAAIEAATKDLRGYFPGGITSDDVEEATARATLMFIELCSDLDDNVTFPCVEIDELTRQLEKGFVPGMKSLVHDIQAIMAARKDSPDSNFHEAAHLICGLSILLSEAAATVVANIPEKN